MSENTKARGAHRLQPRVAASKVALVLLIATLSLSGCVFKRFLGSKAEPTAIPAGEPTSVADEESSEVDAAPEVLPRLIERAKEDLVQTTGAGAEEITVVSTEEVEWGDTSLGCPEPDGMYAQMITPGYLIVLESGDLAYDYHSGSDPEGPLVQCTADGTPAGESQLDENAAPDSGAQDDEVAPSSGAQDDDAAPEVLPRLIERAKEDLVQTTGAGADEITVVSTEEVEWGDTSLGCPEPDGMYAQVITPGYLIVLESGGDVYDYHSGLAPEGPLVQCNLQDDSEE